MDFFVISVCCTVIIGVLVLINGYLVYYTLQKEFEDLHPELFIKAVQKVSPSFTKLPRSEPPTRRGSKTLTPAADVASTAAPSGRTSFTTLTEGGRGTSARTSFTSMATGTRPSSRSSRTPPTTAGEVSTRTSATALTSARQSRATLAGDMSTAAGSATSLATTAVTNASAPPESENISHAN